MLFWREGDGLLGTIDRDAAPVAVYPSHRGPRILGLRIGQWTGEFKPRSKFASDTGWAHPHYPALLGNGGQEHFHNTVRLDSAV